MSNAPGYKAGMFNGMDYNSLMNNPYLYYAMMSPNVNFKAAQENKTVTENPETVSNAALNNGVAVDYAEIQPDESNTGLWVAGTIGAAALIGCMVKGGGNPVKGAKALYERFFKSAETKTPETIKTVLEKMQAVKNGKGEIKLNVPNKTKTFVGGLNINAGVKEYGIKGAVGAEKQVFNPQTSLLNGFRLTTSTGEYKIVIKDGNPVSIIKDGKGGNILQRLTEAKSDTDDGKLLNEIKNIVQELGKDKKDINSTVLQNVKNIRFTNKFGDDALIMNIGHYSDKPQLKAFKTLEQFDKNDVPVLQYVPAESEKIFNNELTKQDSFLGFRYGKKVLADEVKVVSLPPTEIAGAKCFFEGDKLVKIVENEIPYEAGSNGFIQFIEKNEKAIEQFKKDVFVDKIAARIPAGSIIGTV